MTEATSLADEVRLARRLLAPATARGIRVKANVTQERLAREIPVDRTTLSRWESGHATPTGRQRLRYLEVLRDLEQVLAS